MYQRDSSVALEGAMETVRVEYSSEFITEALACNAGDIVLERFLARTDQGAWSHEQVGQRLKGIVRKARLLVEQHMDETLSPADDWSKSFDDACRQWKRSQEIFLEWKRMSRK